MRLPRWYCTCLRWVLSRQRREHSEHPIQSNSPSPNPWSPLVFHIGNCFFFFLHLYRPRAEPDLNKLSAAVGSAVGSTLRKPRLPRTNWGAKPSIDTCSKPCMLTDSSALRIWRARIVRRTRSSSSLSFSRSASVSLPGLTCTLSSFWSTSWCFSGVTSSKACRQKSTDLETRPCVSFPPTSVSAWPWMTRFLGCELVS